MGGQRVGHGAECRKTVMQSILKPMAWLPESLLPGDELVQNTTTNETNNLNLGSSL